MIKYKSILFSAVALCAGFLMTACDDDDTKIENVVTAPLTELIVPTDGQDISFDVNASVRPTVSADADWIIINEIIAKGDGTYTINGEIAANKDKDGNLLEPRSATIAISAFNAASFIYVSQDGKVDYNLNYGSLGMVSSAQELAVKMGTGVNIGNTLESANVDDKGVVSDAKETLWGNPEINQAYIAGIKKAGFSSVRIPCSWVVHYVKVKDVMGNDSVTTTIDPEWIARVKEVVSYCIDNDLYVVLNDHYDGNWIEGSMDDGYHSSKGEQLKDVWTQIANEFNDFDEHLLFAGLNEPAVGEGKSHAFAALTRYEQDFIDAVRATGGNNATRTLIVQGPSTNIDLACSDDYVLPVDNVADRLMAEVHFYDPYQFCLMDEDADWGKIWYYYGSANHVTGAESIRNNGSFGNEQYIADQFKKLSDKFTSKGVPVILGEYGAQNKTAALDQAKQVASRAYWHEIVNKEAVANGCVPFLWECGESGAGEAFSMCDFNRATGAVKNPQVVEAILRGYNAGLQAK